MRGPGLPLLRQVAGHEVLGRDLHQLGVLPRLAALLAGVAPLEEAALIGQIHRRGDLARISLRGGLSLPTTGMGMAESRAWV